MTTEEKYRETLAKFIWTRLRVELFHDLDFSHKDELDATGIITQLLCEWAIPRK